MDTIINTIRSWGRKLFRYTSEDESYYNMNHKNIGKAIIINIETFDDPEKYSQRRGSEEDCRKMEIRLKQLGFHENHIKLLENSSLQEIQNEINIVAGENHVDDDCFVMIVMTHGEMGYLMAKDQKFPVKMLMEPFTNDNCPSLAGKPKLYIIQACRKGDEGTANEDSQEINLTDFLICYSTQPDTESIRNTANGSMFIQNLRDEMSLEKVYYNDFIILLNNVRERINPKPDIENYLTKKLKFTLKK